jgi:hypothetical protein
MLSLNNKERKNKSTQIRRKTYPEKRQGEHLKSLYGITKADQDAQLKEQGYRCAICTEPFTKDCRPCTDHDHSTQVVRGQLCRTCNALLGMARDNTKILENAIQYLMENQCQTQEKNTESAQKEPQILTESEKSSMHTALYSTMAATA